MCGGVKFCEGKGGMCPCWEVCVRIGDDDDDVLYFLYNSNFM